MSGWEIEVAMAKRAGLPPPALPSWQEVGIAIEPMQLWRQALVVSGIGGCVVGLLWFKFAGFSFSLRDLGLSAGATGGGLLLLLLGCIGYKKQPTKPLG